MPTGPHDNLKRFLRNLDERSLPQLAADYLSLNDHQDIVITDGPGDGGRDIHSRTGETRHITQSKFHKDTDATVSSRELSELPMAMIKFGIKQGLFVTTGKISPQGKREFLDNYPGLKLNFLDGPTLARTVLDHPVLSALWIDGESATQVNRVVSFIVIARDMNEDRPILLSSELEVLEQIRQEYLRSGLELSIKAKMSCSLEALPLYAPPSRRTISEFGRRVTGLGFLIRGTAALREVNRLAELTLTAIASHLGKHRHVAVRATHPTITPLAGQHAGTSIQLDSDFPTFRCGPNSIVQEESEYLSPSPKWKSPISFSGSTAHGVAWLSIELNTALDITFTHRMDEETRSREDIIDEQRHQWCKESLFALVPPELSPDRNGDPSLTPSIQSQWSDGRLLLGWLHPSLVSPFFPLAIEPDDYQPEDGTDFPFAGDNIGFSSAIVRISTWCINSGAEIIDPEKAVHMFAALGNHLVPRSPFMAYRVVDLLRGDLPSPFSTDRRHIEFVVCWWLPRQDWTPKDALTLANDELLAEEIEFRLDLNINRRDGAYLICRIKIPTARNPCGTGAAVENAELSLCEQITKIETALRDFGFIFLRDTQRYWDDELLLDFK